MITSTIMTTSMRGMTTSTNMATTRQPRRTTRRLRWSSLRDTIRDSLAAGDKDKADEALHDLGHVLEQIPELAKSHSSDASEAVKQDVDDLFNLFGKLDEQIHAHAEVTYDEYSEKIDAAIERLHERTDHHHAEGKEE